MVKKTLTAKVSPKTLDRLEDHADREGISKSEATDRLLKQGLDVEESDMRLVPVKSDGGTIIENRLDELEKSQQDTFNDVKNELDNVTDKVEKQKGIHALNIAGVGALSIGVIALFGYSQGLIPSILLILFLVPVVMFALVGIGTLWGYYRE